MALKGMGGNVKIAIACGIIFASIVILYSAQGSVFSPEGLAKGKMLTGAFISASCDHAACTLNMIVAFIFALPIALAMFSWIRKHAKEEIELEKKFEAYRLASKNKD